MAKMNIVKPTGGMDSFNVISAFKADNQVYVILDSERVGSMGLPIIYISKFTNKLEKITDGTEWQSVKNYLKGIINGTNFEYVKMSENVSADEAYYTPLTLPQASFELIRSRYIIGDNTSEKNLELRKPSSVTVSDLLNEMAPTFKEEAPSTVTPIIPSTVANSNMQSAPVPIIEPMKAKPIEPTLEAPVSASRESVSQSSLNETSSSLGSRNDSFNIEKETFMKACENMFDALMNKYERKLADLEIREQNLLKKEQEIDMKLKNASEHLANAEAREKVANIAHDNAQRVMDISNLMPNNPNNNN